MLIFNFFEILYPRTYFGKIMERKFLEKKIDGRFFINITTLNFLMKMGFSPFFWLEKRKNENSKRMVFLTIYFKSNHSYSSYSFKLSPFRTSLNRLLKYRFISKWFNFELPFTIRIEVSVAKLNSWSRK